LTQPLELDNFELQNPFGFFQIIHLS